MTARLVVTDIAKRYGRAEVLTGLNFEVAKGQVVTVIGPNGAGKSTTLNALMAVLPSHGQVIFDGTDLADITLEERVMAGLALGNLRLDLIKLRSSGIESALGDVSTATQEARVLSRDIGIALDAAAELRKL